MVRRVGERDGFGGAAEALFVERLGQERVEGRRDEKVEMPDPRELPKRFGHGRRELLHQVADARVDFLAATAALEVTADDLVQRVVARAVFGRHAQALGEPGGEETLERNLAAGAIGDVEQFGPDDRNHATLIDVFEKIVPKKILLSGGGLKHGAVGDDWVTT